MADSSYLYCKTEDDNLFVFINSWDNKIVKVSFFNAIQFIGCSSFVEDVYEVEEKSQFLEEALKLYYRVVPETCPFKVFVIKDIDEVAIFEVVAEGVQIYKE